MCIPSLSLGKGQILLGSSLKSLARVRKRIRNVSLSSTGLIPSVGSLQCDKHCLRKLNIDVGNFGFPTVLVPQMAKTGSQWQAGLFASASSILLPLKQTC